MKSEKMEGGKVQKEGVGIEDDKYVNGMCSFISTA